MDFLNEQDNENFSSSPEPSAPPPNIQTTETDIRVNFTGQYNQYVNSQPPRQFVVQPGGEGPWSTGLFDCGTDVGNSCVTLWCPCITFGRISEIVDKGASSCVANGAIYALLAYFTGCGCILSCAYRTKMRKQLMLSKSPCGDCVVHGCCEPCALCQEYRELQSRGFDMTLGWEGNVERQNGSVPMAPVVQGGMSR